MYFLSSALLGSKPWLNGSSWWAVIVCHRELGNKPSEDRHACSLRNRSWPDECSRRFFLTDWIPKVWATMWAGVYPKMSVDLVFSKQYIYRECRNDITAGGGGQVYRLARRLAWHFTSVRTRRQVLPQHEARYRRPRSTNHRGQERLRPKIRLVVFFTLKSLDNTVKRLLSLQNTSASTPYRARYMLHYKETKNKTHNETFFKKCVCLCPC